MNNIWQFFYLSVFLSLTQRLRSGATITYGGSQKTHCSSLSKSNSQYLQFFILHLFYGLHLPLESIKIPPVQRKHSPVLRSIYAQFSSSILTHSPFLDTLFPNVHSSHTPLDE